MIDGLASHGPCNPRDRIFARGARSRYHASKERLLFGHRESGSQIPTDHVVMSATDPSAPPFAGVHLQGKKCRENGTYPAMTICNKGVNGVFVLAGYVPKDSAAMKAGVVSPDFIVVERVSLMFWADLPRYFRATDYAPLVQKIRRRLPEGWRAWKQREDLMGPE